MDFTHKSAPLRVYLVEDSALIRQRLTLMLNNLAGVELMGWAEEPQAALLGIEQTHAELVIIDMMLLGGSGMTILRGLRAQQADVVSIVLTNYAIPEFRHESLQAGAHYFFDKTNEFALVLETVQGIANRHAGTQSQDLN
jgi:DNA-binding NarL/FixJ family response regulator